MMEDLEGLIDKSVVFEVGRVLSSPKVADILGFESVGGNAGGGDKQALNAVVSRYDGRIFSLGNGCSFPPDGLLEVVFSFDVSEGYTDFEAPPSLNYLACMNLKIGMYEANRLIIKENWELGLV